MSTPKRFQSATPAFPLNPAHGYHENEHGKGASDGHRIHWEDKPPLERWQKTWKLFTSDLNPTRKGDWRITADALEKLTHEVKHGSFGDVVTVTHDALTVHKERHAFYANGTVETWWTPVTIFGVFYPVYSSYTAEYILDAIRFVCYRRRRPLDIDVASACVGEVTSLWLSHDNRHALIASRRTSDA